MLGLTEKRGATLLIHLLALDGLELTSENVILYL